MHFFTAIDFTDPRKYLPRCTFLLKQTLIDKNMEYYLYMTPPVQKLKGVILRKTFYDLGCVPRAYFYFKS